MPIAHGGLLQPLPSIPAPLSNLRVLPNPARPGQTVHAWLTSDGCLAWIPGSEVVTVAGESVTLTHVADRFCGVPTPGYDLEFPLGEFAAGTYTLTYAPTSYFHNVYEVQTAQFVVEAPVALPAISHGLPVFLLLAGMLAIAARHITVRSNASPRSDTVSTAPMQS